MMATPNPIILSTTTRLPPTKLRAHSRSPSRSPIRKSRFLAKELDPLLSNLSPDSTLKALQATSTISQDGTGQDALAKSISDVSPAEREIGIRAAVAAQKLKEWRREVEQWTWPTRRSRGCGAGFLPPKSVSTGTTPTTVSSYLGYLPTEVVYNYEERIEDIRDGVEALELEDIKDHVFTAHAPHNNPPMPEKSTYSPHSSYGRMRDFTALVTATVVQALPDMANLNMLLDTWDIRLSILRQIPKLENSTKTTRAGIDTAKSIVQSPETGHLVTVEEFEITKKILGDTVASLGSKIDKFLDMLEGQEDTLPQEWIDSLEDIENDYAAWVVEAEHISTRNELLDQPKPEPATDKAALFDEPHVNQKVGAPIPSLHTQDQNLRSQQPPLAQVTLQEAQTPPVVASTDPYTDFPFLKTIPPSSMHSKKPSLSVKTNPNGHRRDVSEVSMAESAFSGMSDLSQAEIVDAKTTQVLTSPKISIVDNPFRASREELSWFTAGQGPYVHGGNKPPPAHRASTTLVEIMSKEQGRHPTLQKSQSHDMLNAVSQSPPSTPSKALRQLTGADSQSSSPLKRSSDEIESSIRRGVTSTRSSSRSPTRLPIRPPISQHPSLTVGPLQIRSHEGGGSGYVSPDLPRRSSKRATTLLSPSEQEAPLRLETVDSYESEPTVNQLQPVQPIETSLLDRSAVLKAESLEDRIKDILTTMPTKIRLTDGSDYDGARQNLSQPPTRSSTPTPSLTLSPVKADRSNRKAAPGDVRLFHLARAGQARDVPPVKLFVRAVGENGERVMVRVGGGWADLGEYLREYSLHHHRGLSNGNLEVAGFPGSQPPRQHASSTATVPSASAAVNTSTDVINEQPARRRSFSSSNFGFGSMSNLMVGKARRSSRSQPIEPSESDMPRSSTPPPVPSIPKSYTSQSPTLSAKTANGRSSTNMISSSPQSKGTLGPELSASTNLRRPISTTTAMTPPNGYVPLGAAGPKTQSRRVASHGALQSTNNEAWVEGMVGKARAVSGNVTSTTVHSPTITTTTTITSRSSPASQRTSMTPYASPSGRSTTPSPGNSTLVETQQRPRPKSRMSFGDVSGIRRVFLRRKSSK